MKKLLFFSLSIILSCTSMAQWTFASSSDKPDFLIEMGIQNKVADHPAVQSFVSSLKLSNCSLPKELSGAINMCTMMGFDNSCRFTFTFECEEKIGDSSAPQKEKVSGAGQYNEKDQSVQVYQIMLDSWKDGRDWISHLRPFSH